MTVPSPRGAHRGLRRGSAAGRRVAGTDRLWGPATVVTTVGPVAAPARRDMVAGLRLLADHAQVTRVGREFDDAGTHWRSAADLDEYCERAVVSLPAPVGDDPADTMLEVLRRGRGSLPMTFVTSGESVSLNLAHAMGDGYFMCRLLPAVMEAARTGDVPAWARLDVATTPLRTALWSFFGRHPGRIRTVLADIRSTPRDLAPAPSPTIGWRPSMACVVRLSSTEAFTELKRWRKAHASGISTVAVTLAALECARRTLRVPSAQAPLVLFDARRYVSRASGEVTGNFCVGMRLSIEDRFEPTSVDRSMKRAVQTGRPLSAMSAGLALSRIARPATPATTAPTAPQWDVAYTHMGRPADIVRLPWTDDGSRRFYTGSLTPAGPTGITFALSEIGNRINVSASFHDNVLDAGVVTDLIDLVCADPAALLESHRSGVHPVSVP